jgi:hypothetical protein
VDTKLHLQVQTLNIASVNIFKLLSDEYLEIETSITKIKGTKLTLLIPDLASINIKNIPSQHQLVGT